MDWPRETIRRRTLKGKAEGGGFVREISMIKLTSFL